MSSFDGPVRLRFAPSPTGYLHIGGVRTALFNWLFARKRADRKFLLRIEDTDLERSEDRFTHDIMASMKWLGMDWDEEPIYQSHHLGLYMERAKELVSRGKAYVCTCSAEAVEAMRVKATAEGKRPQYDRTCRDKNLPATDGATWVIRLKVPLDGAVEYTDLTYGPIKVENTEIDDFVVIRSNGAPTYNLSCVVDDHLSQITHVVRGDDHINNTPKQIHLYQSFGYPLPGFAHLPMILGQDKKKLSKRNGVVSVNAYRAEGYLPEALLNFLARLGWSHGDQEVFTLPELIEAFNFENTQRSSGVFNQEKLVWINGEHIRRADPKRLASIVAEDFAAMFAASAGGTGGSEIARVNTRIGHQLAGMIQPKVKLVKEMAEQLVPLCTPGVVEIDPATVNALKWNKDAELKAKTQTAIRAAIDEFRAVIAKHGRTERAGADAVWGGSPSLGDAGLGHTEIDAILRRLAEANGVKLGDVAQPMRLWVSARGASASLFELLAALPWDVVEPRLARTV